MKALAVTTVKVTGKQHGEPLLCVPVTLHYWSTNGIPVYSTESITLCSITTGLAE